MEFQPIGHVLTGPELKFGAPHQPRPTEERNVVRLMSGQNFELALSDLEGIERIWLVSWFHQNATWRPRVLPPRGPAVRRGVFATRAPYRPNPIGLTCVRLYEISGLDLIVGPLDLVGGTPILDIKPYIPEVDSFPESRSGWIDALVNEESSHKVMIEAPAIEQFKWIQMRGLPFQDRAVAILTADPSPHRTRRILKLKSGESRLSCGPWRIYFDVQDQTVLIRRRNCGYKRQTLLNQEVLHRETLLAFLDIWDVDH